MFDEVVQQIFKLFDEDNKLELSQEEMDSLQDKDTVYLQYV